MTGLIQPPASHSSLLLLKTDDMGSPIWARSLGANTSHYGTQIEPALDNGIIVAGVGIDAQSLSHALLLKTSGNGTFEWSKWYTIEGIGTTGLDVVATSDGGYLLGGEYLSGIHYARRMFVVKTNSTGDTLWTWNFGVVDSIATYFGSLIETSSGDIMICGSSSADTRDALLIKLDANGNMISCKGIGSIKAERGKEVIETSDGGYAMLGEAEGNNVVFGALYIVRMNSQGDTLWTRTYDEDLEDIGEQIVETADKGFLILSTGYEVPSNKNMTVLRIDSLGELVWARSYGGYHDDYAVSMIVDSNFQITVFGHSRSFNLNTDIYMLRMDSLGNSECKEIPINITEGYGNSSTTFYNTYSSGGSYQSNPELPSVVFLNDSLLCGAASVDSETLVFDSYTYPNPFTTSTILRVEGINGSATLQLYDQLGRQLRSLTITQQETILYRKSLRAGIYFYSLQSGQGLSGTGKLVVVD